MSEEREEHAAGADQARLREGQNGRASGSGGQADGGERRKRGDGIGGLFGSASVDYQEAAADYQEAATPARAAEPPPPAQPGVSAQPAVPAQPEMPGQPGVPGQPAVPGQPGGPALAEAPTQLAVPAQPGLSGRPEVPPEPGAPGQPGRGSGADTRPEAAAAARTLADTDPDIVSPDDQPRTRTRRRGRAAGSTGPADWQAGGRGTHARNAAREAQRSAQPGPAVVAITAEPDGPAPLLLPPRRRAPARGWRRTVYQASAGMIRIPASSAEERRRDMISRARTPVAAGHYRVAVLSLKGGVGKTTTAVGLGSTLASVRGDRIIAIDANPDRGTLSDKITPQTTATIRDLLDDKAQIRRYADVRGFTSQAASRLEVLASAQDPAVSVAFSEADYGDACAVLERYYSVCVTDCGTGLMHSAMTGVLRLADQIVLVTTASVDGARSASACMDWLAAHGHQDLVRNGVVVVTAARKRGRPAVDHGLLEDHFAARCRAVAWVPYDPYLAQGAEVELDQLRRRTAEAFLELAAAVGDGFSRRREPRAIGPAAGLAGE